MNVTHFIEFCKKLIHDCPTPVFLIVDGSSAHTAKIVKGYVASTEGQLSCCCCIEAKSILAVHQAERQDPSNALVNPYKPDI
jgi:hypothetical protein